jgi:mannonate dehydratase
MNRRAFVRAAMLAPIATTAGCRLSFEQGLYSACRTGIDPVATSLVEAAWEGLRPELVWDTHAHVFGNGRGKVGIFVGPELDKPFWPGARARREFFMNGGCVGEDDDKVDQRMMRRLTRLVADLPAGARLMLLAFDATYDATGERRPDITGFLVPTTMCAALPPRFPRASSGRLPCTRTGPTRSRSSSA